MLCVTYCGSFDAEGMLRDWISFKGSARLALQVDSMARGCCCFGDAFVVVVATTEQSVVRRFNRK